MSELPPRSENEVAPGSYQRCVQIMGAFVAERKTIRTFRLPASGAFATRQSGPFEGRARVGSVQVEDMTASLPGTPILYDVQIFTEESVARGAPVARLEKDLPALHRKEYIDFLSQQLVQRTVVSEQGTDVLAREYLVPDEVELLAEQLSTLGSATRPLDEA